MRAESSRLSDLRKKAFASLRHFGLREGELPNNLGQYRVYLPYFDLNGHASLAFANEDNSCFRSLSKSMAIARARPTTSASWRGFSISVGRMGLGSNGFLA
jgi:hypothetical protein